MIEIDLEVGKGQIEILAPGIGHVLPESAQCLGRSQLTGRNPLIRQIAHHMAYSVVGGQEQEDVLHSVVFIEIVQQPLDVSVEAEDLILNLDGSGTIGMTHSVC